MQSEGCNGLLRVVYSREDESHLKSKEKEWVAIMEWMYRSTRNAANRVTASQAILQGLAEDGGLYYRSRFRHWIFRLRHWER